MSAEARLTHFHVKLSNFKAAHLPPADLNGLADPYLELNFDQFKIVRTKRIPKTLNPDWSLEKPIEFDYQTRYGDRLRHKKLVIKIMDHDYLSNDDVMGTVEVDLHTLAAGPKLNSLQVNDLSGQPILGARLDFECVMQQFSDFELLVDYITVDQSASPVQGQGAAQVPGSARTLDLQLVDVDAGSDSPLHDPDLHRTAAMPMGDFQQLKLYCMLYSDKRFSLFQNDHAKSKSTKSPQSMSIYWQETLSLRFSKTTVSQLLEDSLTLKVKWAKVGKDETIATAVVPFRQLLQLANGQRFEATMLMNDGISPCGIIKATIHFKDIPTYMQMTDGVHVGGGRFQGAVPFVSPHTRSYDGAVGASGQRADGAPVGMPNIEQLIQRHLLPPGFEQKYDPRSGRTYYVDHKSKTTMWTLPPEVTADTFIMFLARRSARIASANAAAAHDDASSSHRYQPYPQPHAAAAAAAVSAAAASPEQQQARGSIFQVKNEQQRVLDKKIESLRQDAMSVTSLGLLLQVQRKLHELLQQQAQAAPGGWISESSLNIDYRELDLLLEVYPDALESMWTTPTDGTEATMLVRLALQYVEPSSDTNILKNLRRRLSELQEINRGGERFVHSIGHQLAKEVRLGNATPDGWVNADCIRKDRDLLLLIVEKLSQVFEHKIDSDGADGFDGSLYVRSKAPELQPWEQAAMLRDSGQLQPSSSSQYQNGQGYSKRYKQAFVEQIEPSTNLFFKHLPTDFDEADLRALFEPFGQITYCYLHRRKSGKSQGYGYIYFERLQDAIAARAKLHNSDVKPKTFPSAKRPLYVNFERPYADPYDPSYKMDASDDPVPLDDEAAGTASEHAAAVCESALDTETAVVTCPDSPDFAVDGSYEEDVEMLQVSAEQPQPLVAQLVNCPLRVTLHSTITQDERVFEGTLELQRFIIDDIFDNLSNICNQVIEQEIVEKIEVGQDDSSSTQVLTAEELCHYLHSHYQDGNTIHIRITV